MPGSLRRILLPQARNAQGKKLIDEKRNGMPACSLASPRGPPTGLDAPLALELGRPTNDPRNGGMSADVIPNRR
jgi:hypothetical protein